MANAFLIMAGLEWYQYALIGLLFVWSGIVRSGFGFGGVVFSLPFLLLINNQPLIYLPLISVHLLIFSSLTVFQNHRKAKTVADIGSTVDWQFLKKSLMIMIIPKMAGVFGLLTFSSNIISVIIFVIILVYAISYIFNQPFRSNNKWLDIIFLVLGGYISGTSLIGAPLIVAVFSRHVIRQNLRDTLFALWFVLVTIKVLSFLYYDVDFQLLHHVWLLPCAAAGHLIGLRLHNYLLATDSVYFYRLFGCLLLLTGIGGMVKIWL